MTKTIEINLDKDNKLILKCEEIIKEIDDFTLSARDIYELLNFNCGDTYIVKKNISGKEDVIKPIEELFNNIIESLSTINDPIKMMEKDINEFQLEK